MKSTSTWLIFCIAGSLFVLSTLVPYLWKPRDQQLPRPTNIHITDAQPRQLKPTPATVPAPRIVDRPVSQPLEILPAVATMPREEADSQLPLPPSVPLNPGRLASAPLPRSLATPASAGIIEPPLSPADAPPQPLSSTISRHSASSRQSHTVPSSMAAPVRTSVARTTETRGWQGARWPHPARLDRQLHVSEQWPSSATWATAVRRELFQLSQLPTLGHPDGKAILARLASYIRIAPSIGTSLEESSRRHEFSSMVSSLERRIHIWRHVDAGITQHAEDLVRPRLPMNQLLDVVERRLEGAESRQGWRDYLMLEELTGGIQAERISHDALSRLATTILQRMASGSLSPAQQTMLKEDTFQDFEQGLRRLGCRPFSYSTLLKAVEYLEESRSRGAGRMIARACEQLEWSPSPPLAELGNILRASYRQGNIRITISEALVNRGLPDVVDQAESIDNRLMGAHIEGDAITRSGLRLVLVPDDQHWHIGVEVDGVVQAKTQTQRGPATFHNEGESRFQVKKQFLIGPRMIQANPAVARVDIDSRLVNFKTDYDDMPLLGGLARNMARNQYRKGTRTAEKQLQQELARHSEQKLDQRVDQQLESVREIYQRRWLEPMNRLQLSPLAVTMVTRDDKLMMDYRIASRQQLAGFGVRPTIPADSLFQLQLHESAVNNLLENLELDGRRDNLPNLWQQISSSLGIDTADVPGEVPTDVMVELAPVSAIHVRFEAGLLRLQVNLRELRQGNRISWRNFSIVAQYRPGEASTQGSLVRDGHLNVIGRSIRLGDRIALQGIFNKVFSRARPIRILTEDLVNHPALVDTHVNHHVVDNGWLSIAVGTAPSLSR